ncbi:MAG: hypothetical protein ACI8UO_002327 [Verrucomicrobiales bacterium]|jgi:hypothetical protein
MHRCRSGIEQLGRRLLVAGSGALLCLGVSAAVENPAIDAFFDKHCFECHDADSKKGDLDLTSLGSELSEPRNFAQWVKIHDRIESGEMPPKKKQRPAADQQLLATQSLKTALIEAEQARLVGEGRTRIRRLTRVEYENTIRDLFDMPGIALANDLPADGSAYGFDTNSDALDISHVNIAKYVEAADKTLDLAIATQPIAPTIQKRRISLVNRGGFVAHIVMNGDGVLLKDKKPDPDFPPSGYHGHIDQGAHERMGSFRNGASVGLFRHEDESVSPYFMEHVTIYPGRYRVRTSLWSFQWDKGEVLPSRGTEAARLSVVQLTGDGRGGQHPSYVLGFHDAPSLEAQEHELVTWLNHNELIGFNTSSLAPVANYSRKGRSMEFTGPGIAVDWLEVEGPLHDVWPPVSHRVLFGELAMAEFDQDSKVQSPVRKKVRQLGAGQNRPDPDQGLWTVNSDEPLVDANRLLAEFLPKAFRRPVEDNVRADYVGLVEKRLAAGDCFETSMRWAYRAALCSPDFLYHVEPIEEGLDAWGLANRLSFFLWNSVPDERLSAAAQSGAVRRPDALRAEVERMLEDEKSERFVENFLGQWLELHRIASTDPDRKLYPEFSSYLQNSMVLETQAFFREMLDRDLDASHLIDSNFAMLNQKLAVHYGISDVVGSQIKRVDLPPDSPRGGFLTQGAILKITANGTTTSPVPRGAFVMDRLLGQPPEPPPASVPAVEPDVSGATTIREQLAKHRSDPNCASCHAKMDPAGFALEAFDVIGGYRDRYRSIGEGDPAERGSIDPFIGIGFKLGPAVDSSSELPDGRAFSDVVELQQLLTEDSTPLLTNLARQFAVYSTGREVAFSDRDQIAEIVSKTEAKGGGIRTLIHELVQSQIFQTR